MRKYKCPTCHTTTNVIRQTKRGKSILYKCKSCVKYFSIKTIHVDSRAMLLDHLEGLPFRALARKYHLSPMTTWRVCEEALQKLPDNNKFTFKYCNKFSDIFVFDGKYFTVKGYDNGYALLWGIDYLRHEIPIFTLAPTES